MKIAIAFIAATVVAVLWMLAWEPLALAQYLAFPLAFVAFGTAWLLVPDKQVCHE